MKILTLITIILAVVMLFLSSLNGYVLFNDCGCENYRIFAPNSVVLMMSVVSLVLNLCGGCGKNVPGLGHAATTILPSLIATLATGQMLFGAGKKKCKNCASEPLTFKDIWADLSSTVKKGTRKDAWSFKKKCCPRKNGWLWLQFLVSFITLIVSIIANRNFRRGTMALGRGTLAVGKGAAKGALAVGKAGYGAAKDLQKRRVEKKRDIEAGKRARARARKNWKGAGKNVMDRQRVLNRMQQNRVYDASAALSSPSSSRFNRVKPRRASPSGTWKQGDGPPPTLSGSGYGWSYY
jgi:hypothetical protein